MKVWIARVWFAVLAAGVAGVTAYAAKTAGIPHPILAGVSLVAGGLGVYAMTVWAIVTTIDDRV